MIQTLKNKYKFLMTTLKCSIKSGVTAYGAPMTTSDTYYGENADKKKLAASSAL